MVGWDIKNDSASTTRVQKKSRSKVPRSKCYRERTRLAITFKCSQSRLKNGLGGAQSRFSIVLQKEQRHFGSHQLLRRSYGTNFAFQKLSDYYRENIDTLVARKCETQVWDLTKKFSYRERNSQTSFTRYHANDKSHIVMNILCFLNDERRKIVTLCLKSIKKMKIGKRQCAGSTVRQEGLRAPNR